MVTNDSNRSLLKSDTIIEIRAHLNYCCNYRDLLTSKTFVQNSQRHKGKGSHFRVLTVLILF